MNTSHLTIFLGFCKAGPWSLRLLLRFSKFPPALPKSPPALSEFPPVLPESSPQPELPLHLAQRKAHLQVAFHIPYSLASFTISLFQKALRTTVS